MKAHQQPAINLQIARAYLMPAKRSHVKVDVAETFPVFGVNLRGTAKPPRCKSSDISQNREKQNDNCKSRTLHMPNAKVSDGRQPPLTFDLSLSESAGSRPLYSD